VTEFVAYRRNASNDGVATFDDKLFSFSLFGTGEKSLVGTCAVTPQRTKARCAVSGGRRLA
jgi:hypothetical protein